MSLSDSVSAGVVVGLLQAIAGTVIAVYGYRKFGAEFKKVARKVNEVEAHLLVIRGNTAKIAMAAQAEEGVGDEALRALALRLYAKPTKGAAGLVGKSDPVETTPEALEAAWQKDHANTGAIPDGTLGGLQTDDMQISAIGAPRKDGVAQVEGTIGFKPLQKIPQGHIICPRCKGAGKDPAAKRPGIRCVRCDGLQTIVA